MQTKILLFNLSGHGHFDMMAYDRYFQGEFQNYEFPTAAVEESLSHLSKV